jgi:mannose/fructose/N-acetylgalactosamine-specific phosphotransferase system component IIC
MSATLVAALAGWGLLVGLDLVSVAQVMIARPFVAGTVAGILLGDPSSGAIVGAALELFALDLLPVGGVRYPDYGPAAVAAAVTAAGAPGVLGLGPAVAVGLVVAYAGEWAMQWTRWLNSRDVQRCRAGLDAGEPASIAGVQLRGIVRDAGRALGVTLLGLALAAVVRRWLPLDVRAVVLVGTVAVGAALAVGTVGALRLGGRGKASAWLAGGLVIGGLWVLLR